MFPSLQERELQIRITAPLVGLVVRRDRHTQSAPQIQIANGKSSSASQRREEEEEVRAGGKWQSRERNRLQIGLAH